jgi:hypothetical protein
VPQPVIPASGILWGAAATALVGATLADWQRQREEERLARQREREAPKGRKKHGEGGDTGYHAQIQARQMVDINRVEEQKKAEAAIRALEKQHQENLDEMKIAAAIAALDKQEMENKAAIEKAEEEKQKTLTAIEQKAKEDFHAAEQASYSKDINLSDIACVPPPQMCFAPEKQEEKHPNTVAEGASAGWDAIVGLRKMMAGLMLDGRPFRGGPEIKPLVDTDALLIFEKSKSIN